MSASARRASYDDMHDDAVAAARRGAVAAADHRPARGARQSAATAPGQRASAPATLAPVVGRAAARGPAVSRRAGDDHRAGL